MLITKPKAITVSEFIESATMFYIDAGLEKEFADIISTNVNELRTRLLGIATVDGLKRYIQDDTKSLDRIINLLNISEERFKRIITMLRIQKKHTPTSEWPLSKIRKLMLEDHKFMDEICDLLMNGAKMNKYKELVPAYYLESFFINAYTLGRLASTDDTRRLLKKGLDGNYNNKIGQSFFDHVAGIITRVCNKAGLTYAIKKRIPLLGRTVSIVVPDESNPRLLIDITYGVTTSSTQTKYAERAETATAKIRTWNDARSKGQHIVFINILDGAGWVARQADLNKIERCSDYVLNLKSLKTIHDIINYYFDGGVK